MTIKKNFVELFAQVRCPNEILRSYFSWRIIANFENFVEYGAVFDRVLELF